MAMGKRKGEKQAEIWVPTDEIPDSPGHPFYEQLNGILAKHGFDIFVENQCQRFYSETRGRPSLPPAVYFRSLLIGYFEGIDSERGIAWRLADSLSLRGFCGYGLTDKTPNHSTISRNRRLIDTETHQTVFTWALKALAKEGLVKGETLGIDATTLEANAAMRSLVRRDTGAGYEDYLKELAKASGIETPTREDLARLDRKRKKKGSNDDWQDPNDPDAKITKMKDGRTHLAHKAEHAVDLESQAVLAVTIQPADRGDCESLSETLAATLDELAQLAEDEETRREISDRLLAETVLDKGYHSNATLRLQRSLGIRSYCSEPNRGRRRWAGKAAEKAAVYANRRRIRGKRGKALLRLRGERLERPFAHCYETGGMRRIHLRGHPNILKRVLIHAAGFNLGLVMRSLLGFGKPRSGRRLPVAVSAALRAIKGSVAVARHPMRLLRHIHQLRRKPALLTPSLCSAA